MHNVRGTIGHDPAATAAAEGRDLFPVTTKQASREKFFAARHAAFQDAAAAGERIALADEVITSRATLTDADQTAGFVVEWVNPQGQDRWCGKASGGISAEQVVRLITTLSRNGVATTFTVTRTR